MVSLLLVTCSCAPHEWTAEHCVSSVVWWSVSLSAAWTWTTEALMSIMYTAPQTLQFTLFLTPSTGPGSHWSNLLTHCCNSVQSFRLCYYCNAVFIGLVSECGHPLNSLHCLLPTPTRLTARNLMLSTGMVQLCPTVALSPHQLLTIPLDYSIWHCVACIYRYCCQCLTVSVAELTKNRFHIFATGLRGYVDVCRARIQGQWTAVQNGLHHSGHKPRTATVLHCVEAEWVWCIILVCIAAHHRVYD